MHHLIFDSDRDGWGSAALLLAELGPDACTLHPMRGKDAAAVLRDVPGDCAALVLDLPAPATWEAVPERTVTWVDHHVAAWGAPVPTWVRAVLPSNARPTTTMRLLVEAGLVGIPGAMTFVSAMCRRSPPFPWGLVIDAMRDGTPDVEDLPQLLARAPRGEPVPAALLPLLRETEDRLGRVEALLDAAPTSQHGPVVRVDLADAQGIPLAQFSLAMARRYPGCLRVIVHRHGRLYAGRDSKGAGLDLIAHFRGRGLDPRGHAYVCTLAISSKRIDDEIANLVEGAQANRRALQ